ncbi:hypothetical protein J6590_072487 [Homalodisca vitripennis]|nr:hypothetical protein J6590_072487 [Homalodisca vitripennis]
MSGRGRGRPRKIHYKEEEHLCTEDEPCFENCGVCKETVPNDYAMLCDGICSNWYHIKCVELRDKDYISNNLMADKISWFCKACDPKIKSFIKSRASSEGDQIDDINALRGTVEVLLKEVKGIVNDNVMINAKMDQLIDKKISSTPNVVSELVMPSWSKMKNSYGRGRGRGLRDTNTSLNTNIMKNQGNYSQTQSILSADLEDVTENQSNNSNVHIDSVNRLPNTHLNSVTLDFVKCSQLRTKYEDYASFHIEVNETDMDKWLLAYEIQGSSSKRSSHQRDFIKRTFFTHGRQLAELNPNRRLRPQSPDDVPRTQEDDNSMNLVFLNIQGLKDKSVILEGFLLGLRVSVVCI